MNPAAAPDFSRQLANPMLIEAALALAENRLSEAEPLLRAHLKADPFDVAAIRMFAELAGRIGRMVDAENLLRRALELAPGFFAARSNLAMVLYRLNRPTEALAELDTLIASDAGHSGNANLKAAALGRIGEYDEALALYEQVLAAVPDQPKVWMSYGHVLKTVGRQADCITAYRRALAIMPWFGEVWWSLANLKTVKFDDQDLAAMASALDRDALDDEHRFHLHFALGKGWEERGDAARAFAHYAQANALRRESIEYDAGEISAHVAASQALFTPQFLAERAGLGCTAEDPIFILGMPRAGSTLIEQILASHSLIEGTMELPDIPMLAKRIGSGARWTDALAALSGEALAALGAEFIANTRIQRKTGKPLFIDKLPNNWLHIGLILLILPKARIIDARRHPLACCFSNFKQHFARGQGFSYDLADMGHYYRDYVSLTAHFDRVAPGRIIRVDHEALLDDSEGGIRALLSALDLPFEEGCLRFWENDRAVRTASSEQVRRPINRDGADQWQIFEPWLDPLKQALGPVLG